MPNDIYLHKEFPVINTKKSLEVALFVYNLKNGIWLIGIPSWLFGIFDRSFASFADGYLSAIELIQLFTASLFFFSWLYLKPEQTLDSSGLASLPSYQSDSSLSPFKKYLSATQSRMLELENQHMIRQEYILPFPYLCQIYHLLNLKHLETIHSFSLNNLRVIQVSQFQVTDSGGKIQFQTILESPFNALRIWRPPIVEVDLILHSPYTVELSIPVYNDRRIIVIFNVLPINNRKHKLFIDIYSNLGWPKGLLQILLHFASSLTLFEDLPYLRQLAARNIHRLFKLSGGSNHETMLLFNRFVDLYGSSLELSPATEVIE
jgi:hypothetical protein